MQKVIKRANVEAQRYCVKNKWMKIITKMLLIIAIITLLKLVLLIYQVG